MNKEQSLVSTQLKVGIFSILGFLLIASMTILVNNRPFWWRSCQLVHISVDDATGLKTKSPIRSLGIDIGYLKSVELYESHVLLNICITASVSLLPETHAYIRGEGFLGDKFVELKPVKYKGLQSFLKRLSDWKLFSEACAEESVKRGAKKKGQEVLMGVPSEDAQALIGKMGELVNQLNGFTHSLRDAIDPIDLKNILKQMNQTLENANKSLSPQGSLTKTAQRSLLKLEDAIEQVRDLMTRINRGEGSLGMVLNDPSFAEEAKRALQNTNRLLNRFSEVQFILNIGGAMLSAYSGGRGYFNVGVWPTKDRYYLLGVASDSRGRISNTTVTVSSGGQSVVTQTQVADQTALLFTVMIGKVFWNRIDLSIGALYGDGAFSTQLFLGPKEKERRFIFQNDVYVRSSVGQIDDRMTVSYMAFPNFYLRAGLESVRTLNGKVPWVYGGGITFSDEDIKVLFALK